MLEKFLVKRLNSKPIQGHEMFLNKEDVTGDCEELAIIHTNPMNSNATATNYNKTTASNCKTVCTG